MRRLLTVLLLLLAGTARAAFLEGVVVEHRSNRALARTEVTLQGLGEGALSTKALTDSAGQFFFPQLPAGSYLVSASRDGYSRGYFGQRSPNEPGRLIELGADAAFVAEIQLYKLGVITGQVTDENGIGVQDYEVFAYRAGPRLRPFASAHTDDRGVFRLARLPAGKYFVRTGPFRLEDASGRLPTYHARTVLVPEARVALVRLDDEIPLTAMEPLEGKLSRLEGYLLGPYADQEAPAVSVVLANEFGTRTTTAVPGGTFSFEGLGRGDHELWAETVIGRAAYSAYVKFTVSKDAERVNLQLARSPDLNVSCQSAQGGRMLRDQAQGVTVFLRRSGLPESDPREFACGQPATIPAGSWDVAVKVPTDRYWARFPMGKVVAGAYRFAADSGRYPWLSVTIGNSPGKVGGIVKAGGVPVPGAPVYLRPNDEELRARIGGLRLERTGADGKFSFAGVPPGRYQAFSTFEFIDFQESEARAGGAAVTVSEGGAAEIELALLEPEPL